MTRIPSLESLGSPRILVIGDLILDEYLWGDVSRISPEAPVPVLRVRHREHRCGGAGSVVENLVALGARVEAIGLVGADEAGRAITDRFESQGVPTAGLISCEDRPTTLKTRMLGGVQHANRGRQQVLRVDQEEDRPVEPERIESALARCRAWLEGEAPAAILLSDYEKGLLVPELISGVVALAAPLGVPVLVDPGRSVDYDRYRGATLICPNRFETEQATGITVRRPEDAERAGRALVERLSLEHAALTLDRDGITCVSQGGGARSFPTRVRSVTDVAGAGDMVLSLLGIALAAGWEIDDAIRLANLGAGIEVSKVGVVPVERWEIEQAAALDGGESPSKVRSLPELARILARERSAGQQIVFTNGCFDLLHAGHVQLLEKARALGQVLVLGLNTDRSIREQKGPQRPVLAGEERARVLSGLASVDHIVFFDEETPAELVEAVQPDILVKGQDYADKVVVGREVVEARGGRVELVDLREGSSTSAIIERIHRAERPRTS
ncbi:MAG: D-glycero-beta-D-manno-heptose 1-phosphate adenylyltransferase [Planctomycetota bacterium]|jgi:D-beta-D-heptose 7-phosphate kinase/D-beta-D-heptose 1-phosphate adenosyltransferase